MYPSLHPRHCSSLTALDLPATCSQVLRVIPAVANAGQGTAKERCGKLALGIIETLLQKQKAFKELQAEQPANDPSGGKRLEKIILSESYSAEGAVQGKGLLPEIINFLKAGYNPRLQLSAARVLKLLAGGTDALPLFRQMEVEVQHAVLGCFVAALRMHDPIPDGAPEDCVGAHVAELLIVALEGNKPSPGMAHFLCGFDLSNHRALLCGRPTPDTAPGAVPQDAPPESCLDAILDELGQGGVARRSPHMAALYYEVVYRLAAHPDMGPAALAYLASLDFFAHQRKALKAQRRADAPVAMDAAPAGAGAPWQDSRELAAVYRQQACLLKTMALLLHVEHRPLPALPGPSGGYLTSSSGSSSSSSSSSSNAAVREVVRWCWDRDSANLSAEPSVLPLGFPGWAPAAGMPRSSFHSGPAARAPDQPVAFVLEFLQDLDWRTLLLRHEVPPVPPPSAQCPVLRGLSLRPLAATPGAARAYDLRALKQECNAALHRAGMSLPPDVGDQNRDLRLQREAAVMELLDAAFTANHRFVLYHAICDAVEGWAQVVDVTLHKACAGAGHDALSDISQVMLGLSQRRRVGRDQKAFA